MVGDAAAAVLWLSAGLVKIPPLTWEIERLLGALRKQSRLNAAAAFCAAAIFQALLILMPTCITL
jgi:hypothetical protein